MAYNPHDYYYNKAKKENYAARSVFKLQEIDQRYRIFKQGQFILDLGAAPGSWSQWMSQKIGKSGRIVGIDLSPIAITLPNAKFFVKDIRDPGLFDFLQSQQLPTVFDGVVSDMAPKTTGIRVTDQVRSMELCEMALETAQKCLKPEGFLVLKFFHSEAFEELRTKLKKAFRSIDILRPKSTRKESKEIFLISKGFKGNTPDKLA